LGIPAGVGLRDHRPGRGPGSTPTASGDDAEQRDRRNKTKRRCDETTRRGVLHRASTHQKRLTFGHYPGAETLITQLSYRPAQGRDGSRSTSTLDGYRAVRKIRWVRA